MILNTEGNHRANLNNLCFAAKSEEIKTYLKHNPMNINYDKGCPLILAIRSIESYPSPSYIDIIATMKTLIEEGADIHINDDSPICWAMRVKNNAAVEYLISLDKKFKLDEEDVNNYLYSSPNLNLTLNSQVVELLKNAIVPMDQSIRLGA